MRLGATTIPNVPLDELAECWRALDAMPQFQLANDPQLTATGRVSGPRGRRSIDLQLIDKAGHVAQKLSVPASF